MESKKTPEYKAQAKRYWMKKRYGLAPEDADLMLMAQGNVCASCGAEEAGNKNGWAIDHDHTTGAIRGVLCHGCNVGLGGFADSIEKLEAAIRYLRKHQPC